MNIIDVYSLLQPIERRVLTIDCLKKEIASRQEELASQTQQLESLKKHQASLIREALDRGETISSPLEDMLFEVYVLEFDKIKQFVRWSSLLQRGKNNYLLICFAYPGLQSEVQYGGSGEHYETKRHFVLGKLSGEAVSLSPGNKVLHTAPSIHLPFSHFMMHDSGRGAEWTCGTGNYEITGYSLQGAFSTLVFDAVPVAKELPEIVYVTGDYSIRCTIPFSPEFSIPEFFSLAEEEIRKRIKELEAHINPEEVFQASDI